MPRTTVTSKGQVTIPLEIREKAKITAGSQLDFQMQDEDTIIIHLVSHDVCKLKGIVKTKRKKPVSLKEMKAAVISGAKESLQ